jgi:hypothetical protein
MNVKLLRRIQKHILAEPKRFRMLDWIEKQTATDPTYIADDSERVSFPKCGTVACIGGWAVLLSKKKPSRTHYEGFRAAKLLGLNRPHGHLDRVRSTDSERLFFTEAWPIDFSMKFNRAKTPEDRARIAAKRIDHFIKTKGAE